MGVCCSDKNIVYDFEGSGVFTLHQGEPAEESRSILQIIFAF